MSIVMMMRERQWRGDVQQQQSVQHKDKLQHDHMAWRPQVYTKLHAVMQRPAFSTWWVEAEEWQKERIYGVMNVKMFRVPAVK
jgi:hypothetical protein